MLPLETESSPRSYPDLFSTELHRKKKSGDLARIPENTMPLEPSVLLVSGRYLQANMLTSGVDLMISSCSRRNAFSSSPYKRGMLTSKMPSKQYAISSMRVVARFAAQDIFWATATDESGWAWHRMAVLIPVISERVSTRSSFDPLMFQSRSKK